MLPAVTDEFVVHVGDCVDVMAEMDENSIDAIVCDPPYGLEFMGAEWDRLDGDRWRAGGDMTQPGIGERAIPWPSYGGADTANATCATCGGRMRGANRCDCDDPQWKVKGEPLDSAVKRALRGMGGEPWEATGPGSGRGTDPYKRPGFDLSIESSRAMQEWHYRWAVQALRVLKPGGFLLAFGGTRTYHRLACAIEDAGFEIRDSIHWTYGSGFPKSLDIGKALDARAGAVRSEVIGVKAGHEDFVDRTDAHAGGGDADGWDRPWKDDPDAVARSHQRLAPVTDLAKQYDGWGTALKPAHEPIVVARKPVVGIVADNVARFGTGGLNIDGCRVGYSGDGDRESARPQGRATTKVAGAQAATPDAGRGLERVGFDWAQPAGRWPSNMVFSHHPDCRAVGERVLVGDQRGEPGGRRTGMGGVGFDKGDPAPNSRVYGNEPVTVFECVPGGCPVADLDAQSGDRPAGGRVAGTEPSRTGQNGIYGEWGRVENQPYGDDGGASRFFPVFRYQPKAARSERQEGMPPGEQNGHPTVKPVELMRWLIRLVTPPGGVVLDPFTGSGSTGMAAGWEHARFVGIEKNPDYAQRIAVPRIARAYALAADAGQQLGLFD